MVLAAFGANVGTGRPTASPFTTGPSTGKSAVVREDRAGRGATAGARLSGVVGVGTVEGRAFPEAGTVATGAGLDGAAAAEVGLAEDVFPEAMLAGLAAGGELCAGLAGEVGRAAFVCTRFAI